MYIGLVLFSLVTLTPVCVMILTSLKTAAEASLDQMWNLPHNPNLDSFRIAYAKLGPHFLNTFKVVVPATVVSVLIGSINGYVLARWRFRGAQALFTILLVGMFIPYQSVLIPLITTLQAMGLYNTLTGLVIVHVVYGIPITTLIFRNFYASIPNEITEAALLDGAGVLRQYRHIIVPLSAPAAVVVAIWQFTSAWNDFLFAVAITGPDRQPVMVALQNLSGSQIVQWNVQMAAAFLAALPTLLVYVLLGRYFVRGLLAGALKG
ncbi:carbohydrate ABC transporter permease [Thermaerobacter subterraneus]|uniref:Carbohydrate ABC transporter membrane protein 2, CUT1 family n=1 Tax=Thermaerobacter subterraneus DSM 13965 TaxID=867903 RepID=K6Q1W4_9FIRM|nr:carbohydrate ABC transporter permease [Thermaerobacter subterraneus]EKP95168.1 carbohydrate ABC transporter membrane protein 2, CUT1 family [Thermaerobacter subterraneus DSM 13965]